VVAADTRKPGLRRNEGNNPKKKKDKYYLYIKRRGKEEEGKKERHVLPLYSISVMLVALCC
jgi:hypothetical protein